MVRKWLVVALGLAVVLAPADGVGAKKKKKPKVQQVVEGSVNFPAGDQSGQVGRCVSGAHRRLANVVGDQAQGQLGYHFDVDQATWGGKFVLEVDGDQDLDLTFYPDFTDDGAANAVSYEEDGPGGESGAIPANMTKAIVCMFSGTNAAFTYTGTGK